jgi:transposase-like protein
MSKYPDERRAAALAKLMPPNSRTVAEVAAEEGVSTATIYNWRKQARDHGQCLPDVHVDGPEGWTARDKFAAVLETAAMNGHERAEYCRRRGLYPEQIMAWRASCEQANDWSAREAQRRGQSARESKQQIKALERELKRKNAALAETAALLTLSKKARAIWGGDEDA